MNFFQIVAEITGESYFGTRHALETLSQLIVYDDLYEELKIARDVYVSDAPAFPYRGILLDTSRNFIDKETILRTIKAIVYPTLAELRPNSPSMELTRRTRFIPKRMSMKLSNMACSMVLESCRNLMLPLMLAKDGNG